MGVNAVPATAATSKDWYTKSYSTVTDFARLRG